MIKQIKVDRRTMKGLFGEKIEDPNDFVERVNSIANGIDGIVLNIAYPNKLFSVITYTE